MMMMVVGRAATYAKAMSAVGKRHPIKDTSLDEQIYRTKYGGSSKLGDRLLKLRPQLVRREVTPFPCKLGQLLRDQATWPCVA